MVGRSIISVLEKKSGKMRMRRKIANTKKSNKALKSCEL